MKVFARDGSTVSVLVCQMHSSKSSLKLIKDSYACILCQLFEQDSLTEELKEDIRDLKAKLSEVPSDPVNTDQATLLKELKDNVKNLKAKFLEVTPVSVNTDSNSSNSLQLDLKSAHTSNPQLQNPTAITSQPRPRTTVSERNFNVVIYGIRECPKNTSKPTRSKNELDRFLPALSKVDPSIQSTSIKDFRRLGTYKEVHTHPRPILVKFLRSFDANTILSNRSQISPPFVIKPDRSQEDRNTESMLLREQWNLIQQGTD